MSFTENLSKTSPLKSSINPTSSSQIKAEETKKEIKRLPLTFKIVKRRSPWTKQEDNSIIFLVNKYGTANWSQISMEMSKTCSLTYRSGKQCRERWHNHLDPNVNKSFWGEKEESILLEKHMELGNKWSDIAKYLPGRTDNAIKNHFYSKLRKYIRKIWKQINRESLLKENGIDPNKYNSDKIYKLLKKSKMSYKNLNKENVINLIKYNENKLSNINTEFADLLGLGITKGNKKKIKNKKKKIISNTVPLINFNYINNQPNPLNEESFYSKLLNNEDKNNNIILNKKRKRNKKSKRSISLSVPEKKTKFNFSITQNFINPLHPQLNNNNIVINQCSNERINPKVNTNFFVQKSNLPPLNQISQPNNANTFVPNKIIISKKEPNIKILASDYEDDIEKINNQPQYSVYPEVNPMLNLNECYDFIDNNANAIGINNSFNKNILNFQRVPKVQDLQAMSNYNGPPMININFNNMNNNFPDAIPNINQNNNSINNDMLLNTYNYNKSFIAPLSTKNILNNDKNLFNLDKSTPRRKIIPIEIPYSACDNPSNMNNNNIDVTPRYGSNYGDLYGQFFDNIQPQISPVNLTNMILFPQSRRNIFNLDFKNNINAFSYQAPIDLVNMKKHDLSMSKNNSHNSKGNSGDTLGNKSAFNNLSNNINNVNIEEGTVRKPTPSRNLKLQLDMDLISSSNNINSINSNKNNGGSFLNLQLNDNLISLSPVSAFNYNFNNIMDHK